MSHLKTRASHTIRTAIPSLILAVSFSAVLQASTSEISCSVALVSAQQHLVEVQIIIPPGSAEREFQLPVWNALYQIRDFSQYINWIRAKDRSGKPLIIHTLEKSRWQVEGTAEGAILEYQIYLDSPGPFGAQFNSHHAFLNLAQVLMYPVDARNSAFALRFSRIPNNWRIATPLRLVESAFVADSYDRLVDSPVEIGDFQERDFEESGGHFRAIFDADASDYDAQKIVVALRKIVAAAISWMNDRPFETYTFFYHFPRGPAGGGMEHAYSTAIDINAEQLKQNLDALESVTAHEFFHLWNVKRIRPRTLEPIDYAKENYTRALWFSEGVTSTAEGTIQLRGGLLDEKQYLARLGEQITELQTRPAHLTQSAEDSSLDAWLEGFPYYRRPERSISYYNKGELLGIMLDLAVRESSHGKASIREILQWMNSNYAKQGRFFDDSSGVQQAAEAVSHADLGWFFARYVAGTDEIPWDDFFRPVGLHVEVSSSSVADPGFAASRNFDGPMSVAAVTSGSEAEHAGLQPGDTILELQGKNVAQDLRQEFSRLSSGDTVSIKVRSRRGVERELKWKVGARQEISYALKDLEQVTPQQRSRRMAWLRGEAQPDSGSGAPEK